MHFCRILSFALLCIFFSISTDEAHGIEAPKEFTDFVASQENIVKAIAEQATALHSRRVQLVRECECSKHACSSDNHSMHCSINYGTPQKCTTPGRRIDSTTSNVITPPEAFSENLSKSLKESICTYKHLDETFHEIYGGDEYGSSYIGKKTYAVANIERLAWRRYPRWTSSSLSFVSSASRQKDGRVLWWVSCLRSSTASMVHWGQYWAEGHCVSCG